VSDSDPLLSLTSGNNSGHSVQSLGPRPYQWPPRRRICQAFTLVSNNRFHSTCNSLVWANWLLENAATCFTTWTEYVTTSQRRNSALQGRPGYAGRETDISPPRTEAPPDQSPLVLGGLLSGGALVRGIMSYTHAGQVNYTVYTAGRRASARFNASRPRNNVIDTLLPLKRVSSSTIKYVLYRWWMVVSVQCIDNISVDKASRVRYRAAVPLINIAHLSE